MGYGCYPIQYIWCKTLFVSNEKAFAQIPDGTNLILHSDQGWQYQMNDYQKRLKEKSKLKGLTPLQFRNQSLKSAC